jgi:hypothetical protein
MNVLETGKPHLENPNMKNDYFAVYIERVTGELRVL